MRAFLTVLQARGGRRGAFMVAASRSRPGKKSFPALEVFKRRGGSGERMAGMSGYHPPRCCQEVKVSGGWVRRQAREGRKA